MKIVHKKVKPEREQQNDKGGRENWWLYFRTRPALYKAIVELKRVLVVPRVSKYMICTWEPKEIIYSDALCIIVSESDANFSVIQSTFHGTWAQLHGSTLETRLRYTPSDCFETFPFPKNLESLECIGERYNQHRQSITLTRQEGLTKTYNRFHDKQVVAEEIVRLRELHKEMDEAVARAYGWDDLALEHGFHETKQGVRYTISNEARREVLGRLLQLNHERYAEEVAQGLHEKGAKKGKGVKTKASRDKLKQQKVDEAEQGTLLFD
jgi:hypothetical protein